MNAEMQIDVETRLRDRHAEFVQTYGFGLPLVVPPVDLVDGSWSISRRIGGFGTGYVAKSTLEASGHILEQGGIVWMSTAMMERESHAWHLHRARGVVVTAGLGLGMFAASAASKPEVDRVVVVEIDAGLIELMTPFIQRLQPEVGRKIEIVHGDATDVLFMQRLHRRIGEIDLLYADIWPDVPNASAPEQTLGMIEALKPIEAGWWGQELQFALDCLHSGRKIDAESLVRFCSQRGLGPIEDAGYLTFCEDVAVAHDLSVDADDWDGP